MKNKLLLAAGIIGIAAVSSVATVAAQQYIQLPWTKNIYNVSSSDQLQYVPTVSVFDDAGNKCYVVKYTAGESTAISCVPVK